MMVDGKHFTANRAAFLVTATLSGSTHNYYLFALNTTGC
jgi:hypothetical protein